jgi:hypothetical protein
MALLTKGFNEVESIIAKTMEYLTIPAVVGHEGFFLNYLCEDFQKLGLKATKYPQLVEISGSAPCSAILCVHVDRHGLISIGNKEYVYAAQHIREIKYGEEHKSSRRDLEIVARRFEGETVYAYDPKTGRKLGEGVIESCVPSMHKGDSLFLVWGMDDIEPGIPLAYARTARARDNYLRGQIDNAISIGVVYALFKAGFQGTALLTTEEEIGKSWLHITRYFESRNLETKDLLVLDTSSFNDLGQAEDGMVVLRNRDKSEHYNPELIARLRERCEALGQPYQMKDEMLIAQGKKTEDLGSTELGRLIQGTKGRWSGATVQIPTSMYHTSKEITTREAIRGYFRFLKNILIRDPLLLKVSVAEKAAS